MPRHAIRHSRSGSEAQRARRSRRRWRRQATGMHAAKAASRRLPCGHEAAPGTSPTGKATSAAQRETAGRPSGYFCGVSQSSSSKAGKRAGAHRQPPERARQPASDKRRQRPCRWPGRPRSALSGFGASLRPSGAASELTSGPSPRSSENPALEAVSAHRDQHCISW